MKYVFVISLDQITADRPVRVKVGNLFVTLVRTGDEIHAISDTCSHEEASLAQGFVGGYEIECPRHGARFDVRTGEPLSLPATEPLKTHPVLLDGTDVLVGIEEEKEEKSHVTTLA